jgi:dienelactone hydrolase
MRNLILFSLSICLIPLASAQTVVESTIKVHNKDIHLETFTKAPASNVLILLHGASGPKIDAYRREASFFAEHGFAVILFHYFDAGRGNAPTDENYRLWVEAVTDLIRELRSEETPPKRRSISLMGMSLGASIALASASQGVDIDSIVDWYGSLPDKYFTELKSMPPLLILHGAKDRVIPLINAEQLVRLCGMAHFECESHFYPNDDHGFTDASLRDAEQRTLTFLVNPKTTGSARKP